ncbi:DUF1631 family protein [Marilutibacter alkalisoli]|uniref:DUF1631 domain-containing protein n=1 Tax=Marilutibacter alkalisoli TaxID=2591633 RepID=A0A514BSN0_9GAMM|nr:DUF1631 family protein [Lysobacter alkalisoli]QDH70325.1 DUF1631 domain-containing protein [Lysobacter alkalisoli]
MNLMDAMPPRAQRLIEQILDLVAERMRPDIELLIKRLDAAMIERAREERDDDMLVQWIDSRQALGQRGADFHPSFIDALRRECLSARDHAAPALSTGMLRDQLRPLMLLDEHIVDEDGALAGIAARHESRASFPLMLLGHRFAVLLERPPLTAALLPVGPQAFCRALRHAAHEIELPIHARMVLYRVYDTQNGPRYEALIGAVNELLDRAGILSGLSFVPLRARSAHPHPARGQGQARAASADNGLLSEVEAMRIVNATLDELTPPGSLPESRLAQYHEAVVAMVHLVSRFGPDSEEWLRCKTVVAEIVDAVRANRAVEPAIGDWIAGSLALAGYAPAERERLAAALVQMGGTAIAGDLESSAARRWQERLNSLPKGALIAFSRDSGIVRVRLRDHHKDAHRVLLANEDSGQETWIDVDTVSRLIADGQAWLLTGTGGTR